jgi:hypothetical protein
MISGFLSLAKSVYSRDDTPAWFGSKEICVIPPDASKASTWSPGERIRRLVEQETLTLAARQQLPWWRYNRPIASSSPWMILRGCGGSPGM